MHTLAQIIQYLVAPLVSASSALSPSLALAAHRPASVGDFTLAAFAVTVGAVGLVCIFWAAWIHARFGNFKLATREEQTAANAAIRFRDAIMAASGQSIVVLASGAKEPFSTGNGTALLQAGMSGPDALLLAGALDALLKNGTSFELSVRTSGNAIAVRGVPIGQRAALFLRDLGQTDTGIDFRAAMDALPVPVWIRGHNLALRWANRAFLAATGTNKLRDALTANAALDRSELELATAAQEGRHIIDAKRYAFIDGQRRALAMSLLPLPDASVAGIAIDVTDITQAEAKLQLNMDANADMLDRMPMAVAIFGTDRKLVSYNSAYAKLWSLAEDWLDTHPTQDEILDSLRETRQLPEQRDFAGWKREQLRQDRSSEEFWHLPGGRSVRVACQPHLLGGVFCTFDDISDRIRLETSFNMLNQVHRATLDTIEEGIAIFEPSGRLVLNNRAFAKLWRLTDDELSGQPHFTKLANLSAAHVGQDSIWSIVAAGVASSEPERCGEWGKATRADGRIISLAMSRLPNGATVVTFTDMTDIERFEAQSKGGGIVAA
ncbi:MAG TPA: PAS-domain containing protein [Rhizomicrobium sp.]|nr:PAS-domain containing protein [Rhizomicrobium sp.]